MKTKKKTTKPQPIELTKKQLTENFKNLSFENNDEFYHELLDNCDYERTNEHNTKEYYAYKLKGPWNVKHPKLLFIYKHYSLMPILIAVSKNLYENGYYTGQELFKKHIDSYKF